MLLSSLVNKPFVHTIVLFRNPKSASSSLFKAIGPKNLFWREKKVLDKVLGGQKKYNGVFDTSHLTPAEAFSIFGRGICNLFSVCCVRNPYERQVSQWNFSRGKNWGKMYGLPDDGTFEEYCEILYKKRRDKNFWPAILQTEYSHGAVPIKYLIRFENLQKDWRRLIKDFEIKDLPESLPWENKTQHEPWQNYLTPRSKEILDEVLDEEFLKLGYKKSLTD